MLLAERLRVAAPPRRRHWSWPPEGAAVFAIAAFGYLAAAAVLAFRFHVATTQALATVANAAYVLMSRDPHLAAIGFVASPLPSIVLFPILPFRILWPALTTDGFAACVVSALFVAGAVYQLVGLLKEAGIPRLLRLLIALLFAIHPLILYTAASGASEAAFLFFLLMAVRHLAHWLRDGDTTAEVVAGFALAGAYLARYDTMIAGVAAMVLVGGVSAVRARQSRLATAVCDALIVGAPLAATAVLWAGAAWLVTGSPLPQVFAPYGYLTQLDALRTHAIEATTAAVSPLRTVTQLLSLEPALPAAAVLLLASLRRLRGRGGEGAVAAASLLTPLAAAVAVASILGWAFPWLRLLIVVVPLVTIVVAVTTSPPPRAGEHGSLPPPRAGEGQGGGIGWLRPLAVLLMLAAAIPTSAAAMLSPKTGQEEQPAVRAIFDGTGTVVTASSSLASARDVAAYLDQQHLGAGSVLLDSVTGFPVILASSAPRQFLITSDREFALALSRPTAFGVAFVLVPAPTYMNSLGSLDALNRTYPDLFQSAAASTGLVREFKGPGDAAEWRLFRVSAIEPPAS